MAKAPTSASASATDAPAADPQYFEVTLNKPVEVQGHRYLAGNHVADEATVAAMGDAVANKRPVSI